MKKLTVTIETENDAFRHNARMEVVCILRELITRIDEGESSGRLRDSNGNTVGAFSLLIPEGGGS